MSEFVSRIEQAIVDRKTDLLHLRVIAERAEPDRQNEYYQIIEEIAHREHAVRDKLAAYPHSAPRERPLLQQEIETLWHRAEEAIEVAKAKMLEF